MMMKLEKLLRNSGSWTIMMTRLGIKRSDLTHPPHHHRHHHHRHHHDHHHCHHHRHQNPLNYHQTLPHYCHNCHNYWNDLHQYSGTPGHIFSPNLPGPQLTQKWTMQTENMDDKAQSFIFVCILARETQFSGLDKTREDAQICSVMVGGRLKARLAATR